MASDGDTMGTHRVNYANTCVCPGCGEEYDPREKSRGMNVTESEYCGLMCVMAEAEGEYDE